MTAISTTFTRSFPGFQRSCEAVVMGRTTFEPALGNDRWPWPDLDVFVLGSQVLTAGAQGPIVTDDDPQRLVDKLRAANRGAAVSTDTKLTLESERPLPDSGPAAGLELLAERDYLQRRAIAARAAAAVRRTAPPG